MGETSGKKEVEEEVTVIGKLCRGVNKERRDQRTEVAGEGKGTPLVPFSLGRPGGVWNRKGLPEPTATWLPHPTGGDDSA